VSDNPLPRGLRPGSLVFARSTGEAAVVLEVFEPRGLGYPTEGVWTVECLFFDGPMRLTYPGDIELSHGP
jgi:hypothetical protein